MPTFLSFVGELGERSRVQDSHSFQIPVKTNGGDAYNLGTWEVETGGSGIQGQLHYVVNSLCGEF